MIAPDELFSGRRARDEDQRALAAECEELRQFVAEYEAWLDGQRDTMPDPTPETLHFHALPTNS